MTDLDEAQVADERTLLDAFLDDARGELLEAVEGLTDEQGRRRLVPSLTSPAAILKHCAFVERIWFQVTLQGRTCAEVGTFEDAAESWVLADDDTLADLVADYRLAGEQARAVAAAYDLDHAMVHRRFGEVSLRFVLLHMLRETNRHAGHADILREQVLSGRG